ncbi:MAG: hypothetical protein AAF298_08550 [Cyanobacteria bacterium P01_A01_bin.40]
MLHTELSNLLENIVIEVNTLHERDRLKFSSLSTQSDRFFILSFWKSDRYFDNES